MERCEGRTLLTFLVPGTPMTLFPDNDRTNTGATFLAREGDRIELSGYDRDVWVSGAEIISSNEATGHAVLRANSTQVSVKVDPNTYRDWARTVSVRFLTPDRGTLVGRLFEDANADRRWQPKETGAIETVFLDANNNGRLDPSETSVETDTDGQFVFTGLTHGQYRVRQGTRSQQPVSGGRSFTLTLHRDKLIRHVNLAAIAPDSPHEVFPVTSDGSSEFGDEIWKTRHRAGSISSPSDVDVFEVSGRFDPFMNYPSGTHRFEFQNVGDTPLWVRARVEVKANEKPHDPDDGLTFSFDPATRFDRLMLPGDRYKWEATVDAPAGDLAYSITFGISAPGNRNYDLKTGAGAVPGGRGGRYAVRCQQDGRWY
jgi:hypothetical protein